MTTYNTGNPLGSAAAKDLYDNAQNLDHLSNDQENELWPDRFGKNRLTWHGMEERYKTALANLGLNPVGTFQGGAVINSAGDIIQDETTGAWYRWDDLTTLPKTVPPSSTPDSSGGTGVEKWLAVDVSDVLRKDLLSDSGADHVKWKNHSVGQVLDNITVRSDDFPTIQEWAAYPAKNKVLVGGDYDLSSTLSIQCETLKTEGRVRILPTGPMKGVFIGSEVRTELATLSASLLSGSLSYTVAGVSVGDTLCFWNPVAGSWSAFRDNWRQGEFVRVQRYEGGIAYWDGGLIDTYPSGTKVFKVDHVKRNVTGDFYIEYPTYDAASIGIEIVQACESDLTGLRVHVKNAPIALHLKRCMNISGKSLSVIQTTETTSTTDYALIISNSQCLDLQGSFCAARHSSTMGGDGDECSIVNRYNRVAGVFRTTGQGGVAAADFHGNCEKCRYEGHAQGVAIAGAQNSVAGMIIDGVTGAPEWPSLIFSELKSMEHDLSNTTINGNGDPGTGNRGCIDIGGNSNVLTAMTSRAGDLNLSGAQIKSPASYVINIRNRGSTAKHNINLTGVTVNGDSGDLAVRVSPVSGISPDAVKLSGFTKSAGMKIAVPNDSAKPGLYLSGQTNVTIANGAAIGSEVVTFADEMPTIPASIVVSRMGVISGNPSYKIGVSASGPSVTGFTINANTNDGSNLTAAFTTVVSWEARW